MKYDFDTVIFPLQIKAIRQLGNIQKIEFDCPAEDDQGMIGFFDEKGNRIFLEVNPDEDEHLDGHLVLLSVLFHKSLSQVGLRDNDYWILQKRQIADIVKILKEHFPYRIEIYNAAYINLE